jgi:hypothetical protein
MKRRDVMVFATGAVLAWSLAAGARQAGKLYHVAFFNSGSASALGDLGFERSFIEAFRLLFDAKGEAQADDPQEPEYRGEEQGRSRA